MEEALRSVASLAAEISGQPEVFVSASLNVERRLLQAATQLYALAKQYEKRGKFVGSPLPELLVDGFDTEQIWEEIQLQNKPIFKQLRKQINELATKTLKKTQEEQLNESDSEDRDEGALDVDEDLKEHIVEPKHTEEKDAEEEKEENEGREEEDDLPQDDGTVDRFFSLEDMERFVEDAEEENEDEFAGDEEEEEDDEKDEGIKDEFPDFGELRDEDIPEEERPGRGRPRPGHQSAAGREIKYDQFFDPPEARSRVARSQMEDLLEEPTSISSGNKTGLSKYEQEQARIRARIADLEEKNIQQKPWLLAGETSASYRPFNSLLETHLEFDSATKVKPMVTEQTTKTLEEIIKGRILDESWDDPERKEDPDVAFRSSKMPPPELDYEKSKRSLSEIYEEQYVKQTTATTTPTVQEELTPEQKEVQRMFRTLCFKLDALSNFHFTPKPPVEEVEVRADLPAISMEEIIPIATSDASLLAPEEIYEPGKKEPQGPNELTQQQRKSLRRAKKRSKKKQKQKLPQTSVVPAQGKNVRIADTTNSTTASSRMTSTKLFTQLTKEATDHIASKKSAKTKKKDNGTSSSAAMWKL